MSLKSLLAFSCIPAIFGCIIQLFIRFYDIFGECYFYFLIITGRFLIGIHSGISLCLLPIYFIETSIQSHRPFLLCLQVRFIRKQKMPYLASISSDFNSGGSNMRV
jgi:uncharacterized membrane protein